MFFLYNISIYLYVIFIRVASLFNGKARKWIKGRNGIFQNIREELQKEPEKNKHKLVWFHCASLGEFEQGRPIMERFRKMDPDHRILLTFFSPSGFEVRKNYSGADYISYLPADTRRNAKEFTDLVQPDMVIFIKYEYWFNYLRELTVRKIPVYFASAIFRPGQHFFQWYGGWFRQQLKKITGFFVQDKESADLLFSIGINRVSVTGDTRFDRVYDIARKDKPFPVISSFCRDAEVLVAGSTWKEDEEILFPFINDDKTDLKFILAPHETQAARIDSLTKRLNKPFLKYSQANEENVQKANILIIDSIGILAYLYKFATFAYVGGGFGAGIHNILEVAAYGIPVIFGPRYEKFREAADLIRSGGAFSVKDVREFLTTVNKLLTDHEYWAHSAQECRQYIQKNQGATDKIIRHIYG
jgi:3-deoxy-D-manno-octulosonic-acid transferase